MYHGETIFHINIKDLAFKCHHLPDYVSALRQILPRDEEYQSLHYNGDIILNFAKFGNRFSLEFSTSKCYLLRRFTMGGILEDVLNLDLI